MTNTRMYTIDFGANLANTRRYPPDKLRRIMKNSWRQGVDRVVSISNDLRESWVNIKLARDYDNLYFTLGIHPHKAKYFKGASDIKFIEDHMNVTGFFGIGECGLDYYRNYSSKEQQIAAFEAQVELAKRTNSKLYLHCRDAHDDFISILKKHNYAKGVVHCFTGNLEEAHELVAMGLKLGITGCLFDRKRNQNLVEVVQHLNLENFVVETDAPFLNYYPRPRTAESSPSDVHFTIREIAKLRNMDVQTCVDVIYNTSRDLLRFT